MANIENRKVINIAFGQCGRAAVGELGAKAISYHEPMGPGDAHYCDVYYEDGTVRRVFDLKSVLFSQAEN